MATKTHPYVLAVRKFRRLHKRLLDVQSTLTSSNISLTLEELLTAPENADPKTKQVYTRILNCLQNPTTRYNQIPGPCLINSVHELLMWRRRELMKIRSFGITLIEKLEEILAEHDLTIGMFADYRTTPDQLKTA